MLELLHIIIVCSVYVQTHVQVFVQLQWGFNHKADKDLSNTFLLKYQYK